jgi:hypothetical protein
MAAASVVAGMNPNSAVSSRSLFILIIVANPLSLRHWGVT